VGRDHVSTRWGGVPEAAGLDAAGILAATARGEVKTLVLLDCDPLADFPDRALAQAAMEAVDRVICVGVFRDGAAARADVVLPPTVWGEQAGTTTNLEGRVSRLARRVAPEGTTMEAWRIAGEIAARLGSDFDLEAVEEVQDEIARVAPAFAGVDSSTLRGARDGVVLPACEHRAEAAPPPVALHEWARQAAAPVTTPLDAYALRLVAARTLYGSDRVTAASESLARLAEDGPRLLVNPRDRERIGVGDGEVVRVTSSRGSLELPLHGDAATPPGSVFIAVNRAGNGALDLIGIDDPVTELRVETIS
jgi:predicted molibdopterin-dependent oxidoreductase YjgC